MTTITERVDAADCQGEGDECYVHGTACADTSRDDASSSAVLKSRHLGAE